MRILVFLFLKKIYSVFKKILIKVRIKIRVIYSKDFIPNWLFIRLFNLDFFFSGINLSIQNGAEDLFEIKEKDQKKKKKFIWYVSKKLKRRLILSFAKGIHQIGTRIAENYALDLIEFKEGDFVIDCGANLGALWIYLNSLDIKINYICVEPGIYEFQGLLKSINYFKNTKIKSHLINKALSDKEGEVSFFYSPNSADSSIIKYSDYDQIQKISTTTIEKIINDLNLKNKQIKLFKLEAEGAEPEVIDGALNAIKNFDYIAADLGPERGFNQECTLKEVSNKIFDEFLIENFKFPRICCLYINKKINLK